jgi:23S rRNA (guanosine2251-2'-O)-methyltransferase
MADVIEGRNAVLEALRSGTRVERVLLAQGMRPDSTVDEIRTIAASTGVPVVEVPRRTLDESSARGAHQGVLAVAAPFAYADLAEVLHSTEGKDRTLLVVLDHVTDPGNLGAVIRTVEVAGGDAVIVPKDRSASVGPIVHKTSAGATSHLPIARVPNIARALEDIKGAGFWVCGADERARENLWYAPLDGRVALVMGAEGEGLARLTRERCDFLVSIPVAGQVTSLNVAQATSVLVFEWVRRGSA